VRYIHDKTEGNYPIIGSGGMMTPADILRMLDAGASLVALNMGIRENGLRLLRRATRAIADREAAAREDEVNTNEES
jgi:dihydroorotate dehydrogenase